MSIATLYSGFKGSIESAAPVDVLSSEIGNDLKGKLEAVGGLTAALGEDWTLAEAQIPDQEVETEQRQRILPHVIPPSQSTATKRSRRGDVLHTIVNTRPGRVTYTTQTYHVQVLRWFNLDGKIGEDVRFFGHFWDDHGTLKFYVVLAFPDEAIEGVFFEHAYWPERGTHHFTRPRVLVFSHPTSNTYGADWPAGTFLLTELELGDRLKAAAGDPDTPLRFGGALGLANGQFTFDLFSWPTRTLTFHDGKMVIEEVRVYGKTQEWSDGEEPRTIEGDDPDQAASEDASPDPHETQFSLGGKLRITDELKLLVWTPLAADGGMAVWNLMLEDDRLPQATLLDPLLGEQAWLAALGGELTGLLLDELQLTVDQPSGALVSASYVLVGTLTVDKAAPETITVPEAHFGCLVSFPGGDGRRESAEVEGRVTLYGTVFELHLRLPEAVLTLVSADGEGFAKWKESFWYQHRLEGGHFEEGEIEGTYERLHVEVDLNVPEFWASVSNDAGDWRWI